MKKQKIEITQKDGIIEIYRNGELESKCNFDVYAEKIKEGKVTSINLANWVAEIMHDCLNCKSASASLKDLNDTESYFGTYFENIDRFND